MDKFSDDLQLARRAAAEACEWIAEQYQQQIESTLKADRSLVTAVDQRAEVIIKSALNETPHGFIGEESPSIAGASGAHWVIDPIDGTTNFFRKNPPFCVSIGLMRGDESMLGVIQNPLTGDCYYAERGRGAFLNDEPIRVSENDSPSKAIVFFNYGSEAADRDRMVQVVSRLIHEVDLRLWGATAWELCAVARGAVDAFVCVGDQIWDFAAGMCIVREAGGEFTDWRGEPWNSSHSFIMASQPQIKPFLIDHLADLQT